MNIFKSLLFALCIISFNTYAQNQTDDEKLSLSSGNIDNQFDYVIKRSNNYQDYKVVKANWLYTLKSHTLDSLKAIQIQLDSTKLVIKNQADEMASLKTNLTNTQQDLEKTTDEKNNMALFGLQMSKSNYNVLMWSIIGVLLACLLLFIYKFKNSNVVTNEAKKALSEIEDEFDEHRKVALEREQKVRRQLQDELNKQK
ncbi:tRNA (guanine-N1)-methyltransferase [Xanthomarina sp. F1114]|uniref:tRNA (guanine-N1)-methyltransferase n=1 Tax=Xanthomarina sp. F1114 TaxID=2996019 RepID=UPI00225E0E76|nr:tRNA (guanine-N1)-methyltransferase [Xanthomarina sp. F1114]MCX7547465.1 tRNA (guanine-N1)-methyltransferase [Xanthomarina sp. F1114]